MKTLILVVLYNLSPTQSQTLQALKSLSRVFEKRPEIFVWVNSAIWTPTDQKELTDLLSEYAVVSRHTPENASLSHIYNSIFDEYSSSDRIIIFDHDTKPTEDYFKEVLSHSRVSDDLIIPQVFSGGRIVSPGGRILSKGYLRKSVTAGVQPSKNVLAINSGMAICPRVTKSIRWDERLRFYGTDSYFMTQYETIRDSLVVTQAKLDHSLAMDQQPTREWRLKFAKEMVRCNNIIYTTLVDRIFNFVFNLWILVRARIG
jgi:hypothetical protein